MFVKIFLSIWITGIRFIFHSKRCFAFHSRNFLNLPVTTAPTMYKYNPEVYKHLLFLCLCPKTLRKSQSKAAALDKRPTLISGKTLLHSRNTTALNTVFNNHTKQTSHTCIIQQALISSLELIFYDILYKKYILLVNTLCKDEYILTIHKHILKILWVKPFPWKTSFNWSKLDREQGFNPLRTNTEGPNVEQDRKRE